MYSISLLTKTRLVSVQCFRCAGRAFWLVVLVLTCSLVARAAAETTAETPARNKTAGTGQWKISLAGKPVQGALLYGKAPAGAQVSVQGKAVAVTKDGDFLVGIGRFDTRPIDLTVNIHEGTYHLTIPVILREFPTEVVNGLPPKKVNPPKEVLQRIRREAAWIKKARSHVDLRKDFLVPFIWPASGRVSGVYGSRRILNGEPKRPHYGMDIANKTGTPVVAAAPGIVRLAEPDLYYSGGTIVIDHGLGLTSTYLHLSAVDVSPGQRVKQGQKIGEIGSTGRATGPHLDWRLNLISKRLDPQLVLNKYNIRR
jgi:murein DD-endopeptidase MepM/ murein hydrolase activator NlpD